MQSCHAINFDFEAFYSALLSLCCVVVVVHAQWLATHYVAINSRGCKHVHQTVDKSLVCSLLDHDVPF